jgi:hypothetical protein
MRNLENDYSRYEAINEAYKAAGESEEAGEKARAEYQELLEEVRTEGQDYGNLMRLYTEMKERGNTYIDIKDPSEYRDEVHLVEAMRTYGIKAFTFTSGWSSAMESLWELEQAGAKNQGMVEVNGSKSYDFSARKETFEKKHGFLFTID